MDTITPKYKFTTALLWVALASVLVGVAYGGFAYGRSRAPKADAELVEVLVPDARIDELEEELLDQMAEYVASMEDQPDGPVHIDQIWPALIYNQHFLGAEQCQLVAFYEVEDGVYKHAGLVVQLPDGTLYPLVKECLPEEEA